MKKKLLKLVAMLLMSLIPQALSAVNWVSYTARYTEDPTIGTDTLSGVAYSTVKYCDLDNGGDPGKPSLPIDYLNFSVPYNATNFTVTALPTGWSNYTLSHQIYPCQAPWVPDGEGTPRPVTLPDTSAYYSGTAFPINLAWVADEGFLAGENHIVTVAVMPFSYTRTSTSAKVKKAQSLNIRLNYTLSDTLAIYPIIRNDSTLRQEGYELTQNMVINPNQVIEYAPPFVSVDSIATLKNTLQAIDTAAYPYVIVTTQEYLYPLRRLVSLKRQKGYNVKLVTMDDVLTDPLAQCGDVVNFIEDFPEACDTTFTDNAGILRQFLRNLYTHNGTKYVFLVGDGVPYRILDYIRGESDTIKNIPSDLYFCDLHGNWLPNSSKQRIEVHPELFVGRIMARSSDQVVNYIDKLLRYELNPGKGDVSYLDRILFTSCSDIVDPFYSDVEYGDKAGLTKYLYRLTMHDSCDIIETTDHKYPSGADIVNRTNENHFNFISFMNYATPFGIITSGYNASELNDSVNYLWAIDTVQIANQDVYLNSTCNSGLNNLNNKWYPSVGYSIGSSTIPFDRRYHEQDVGECFGESFTIGKDYGGPAFIGYTRDVSHDESLYLEESFARKLTEADYTIGRLFGFSKNNRYLSRYAILCNNLLGDPEFTLWPSPNLTQPSSSPECIVLRSDNAVSVRASGYHYISYCDNEGHVITKQLPSYWLTLNNVSPNGSLMVYRNGAIPNMLPFIVQNETIRKSQYVIAVDYDAGNSIDVNRTRGEVTVSSGIEYEIEASGKVTLEDGFKVEKGAKFAVYPSVF